MGLKGGEREREREGREGRSRGREHGRESCTFLGRESGSELCLSDKTVQEGERECVKEVKDGNENAIADGNISDGDDEGEEGDKMI